MIGYATVDGERVALSSARSTRNREVVSAFGFADLNDGTVHDVESFYDAANKIEFTFNWFYADKDDVAMFSGGRLPNRHPQVDLGLPTKGTGKYEWRGFISKDKHPHGTAPSDGTIVNWNNKPAPGWQAADDTWAYGSVHRNDLLESAVEPHARPTPWRPTVGAMNYAATQDLRGGAGLPRDRRRAADRRRPERPGPADVRSACCDWRTQGSSRLDARPQRHHRSSRGGDHGPGMAEVRRRGDGPGAGAGAR